MGVSSLFFRKYLSSMEVTDCDKRYNDTGAWMCGQKLFVKVLYVKQKKWIWHLIKFRN